MKVLLSIKPEFAEMIFNGTKMYEFRRTVFKNQDVKTIVVYASSPVQRVIGEFEIDHIVSDAPIDLWEKTKHQAGINKDFFFKYFIDKQLGFAIKVKNAKLYKHPKNLKEDYNMLPPQSFAYLSL